MKKTTKEPLAKTLHVPPPPLEEVKKQKQKAEQNEVAGRHKNDGQKGHKGAR